MALDHFSKHYQFEDWKIKFDGMFVAKLFGSEKIILVKPQTYMNLSGSCVAKFKLFFKVSEEDIFVIYDDIDLELGHIKFKQGGGDAGHKGVRSISQHLGTKDYNRLRVGIGRPRTKEEVSYFVLSNFSKAEKILMDELPIIPIYTYTRVYMLRNEVKGWYPNMLDTHPYQFISLED